MTTPGTAKYAISSLNKFMPGFTTSDTRMFQEQECQQNIVLSTMQREYRPEQSVIFLSSWQKHKRNLFKQKYYGTKQAKIFIYSKNQLALYKYSDYLY